jgi:hypothetical protein
MSWLTKIIIKMDKKTLIYQPSLNLLRTTLTVQTPGNYAFSENNRRMQTQLDIFHHISSQACTLGMQTILFRACIRLSWRSCTSCMEVSSAWKKSSNSVNITDKLLLQNTKIIVFHSWHCWNRITQASRGYRLSRSFSFSLRSFSFSWISLKKCAVLPLVLVDLLVLLSEACASSFLGH